MEKSRRASSGELGDQDGDVEPGQLGSGLLPNSEIEAFLG
jgi:hypothetical protein